MPDEGRHISGKGRAKRTRTALIDAFNHLVLDRRKRDIRVADIVGQAQVGRSTFYDHYSGAEALHVDALRRPFAALADAAAGKGDEDALTRLLEHFWDYRQLARNSLGDRAQRLLAEMVRDRLGEEKYCLPTPILARQLAAPSFAAMLAWLTGEASATPRDLAHAICRAGRAQAQALQA